MEGRVTVRTPFGGSRRPPGHPAAVWAAFAAQGRWKSWTIIGLLGLGGLQSLAIVRLVSRPPEVVLVDAAGRATPVRRSLASDALLKFLAERSRPPEVATVRFARDFIRYALALNSSTVEEAWPAALAMMAPELRSRVEAEAAKTRLVPTWRLAQRKTEVTFEEVAVEEEAPGLVAIRCRLTRRTGPLIEGSGQSRTDRVQVDLVARVVTATLERPDGLEVAEWRLTPIPVTDSLSKPGGGANGASDVP